MNGGITSGGEDISLVQRLRDGLGGGGGGGGSGGKDKADEEAKATRMRHAAEESAAGAAGAGVRADGHVVHAVTLASKAGRPGGKERLLAFIGVNTGFGSKARRDVLRSTWFPVGAALRKMEVEHGLLFRFVIGDPQVAGDSLDVSLQDEISQHDDFFRLRWGCTAVDFN